MQELIRPRRFSARTKLLRRCKEIRRLLAANRHELLVPLVFHQWRIAFWRREITRLGQKKILPAGMSPYEPAPRHLRLLLQAQFITLGGESTQLVSKRSVLRAACGENQKAKNQKTKEP